MSQLNEYEIKKLICDIGLKMYNRGMVAANDGNLSVRLNENEILCTPTGISKGAMTPECICKIDLQGNVIETCDGYKPSSEVKMHLRVYQKRRDIGAVVHAHPAFSTSFADAGIPLVQPIMTEAVTALGCVPLAPFATPSTNEVPDSIEPYVEQFDAVLLESHGALTWAADLTAAYMKMESVEFYAQLLYRARQLGEIRELDADKVRKMYEVREKLGISASGRYLADSCRNTGKAKCYNCNRCTQDLS